MGGIGGCGFGLVGGIGGCGCGLGNGEDDLGMEQKSSGLGSVQTVSCFRFFHSVFSLF